MHTTEEFEHLLNRENVVAVYWDEEAEVVRVIVTEKVPEDELREGDIVANAVSRDVETDVLDAGLGRDKDAFEPFGTDGEAQLEPTTPQPPKARYRPIKAGVSEIHQSSTAATAGHYPALVVDAENGYWSDDVAKGDLVRISNNHVYARRNLAEYGDYIIQPSPYDGGSVNDTSGTLAGYVPLADGVRVDVAARTSDPEMDTLGGFNLPEEWPTRVVRDPAEYLALVGQSVHKSGRTTGVSTGSVLAHDASARVRFGDGLGVLTLKGQIIAGDMSKGGDSGSPIYTTTGALVGHLFAGSDRFTIINRADAIEAEFGVKLLTGSPQRPGSDGGWLHPDFLRRVWAYIRSVVGERLRTNVYLSGIRRRVDAVVDPDPIATGTQGPWVIEAATSTSMLLKKLGYVLVYATQFQNARPVLVVPEKADIDPEERDAVAHHATVLTELEAIDYFEEELSAA